MEDPQEAFGQVFTILSQVYDNEDNVYSFMDNMAFTRANGKTLSIVLLDGYHKFAIELAQAYVDGKGI